MPEGAFIQPFVIWGLGGVLSAINAWLLIHIITRTLPNNNALHSQALAEKDDKFTEAIAQSRREFIAAIKEDRTTLMALFNQVSDDLRAIHRGERGERGDRGDRGDRGERGSSS